MNKTMQQPNGPGPTMAEQAASRKLMAELKVLIMITVYFPPFTPSEIVLAYWRQRTDNGLLTWRNHICTNSQTGLSYCQYEYL